MKPLVTVLCDQRHGPNQRPRWVGRVELNDEAEPVWKARYGWNRPVSRGEFHSGWCQDCGQTVLYVIPRTELEAAIREARESKPLTFLARSLDKEERGSLASADFYRLVSRWGHPSMSGGLTSDMKINRPVMRPAGRKR